MQAAQKTSEAGRAWNGRAIILVCLIFAASALACQAQQGAAVMNISMAVQSSIGLVFQNNPAVGSVGFCPLTNAGTNNVGLDMGTASEATGDSLACIAFNGGQGNGSYDVTTAFDVVVTKSNSGSPDYRLQASIATPPPAKVIWSLNNKVLSTVFTTLQTTNKYSTRITETLNVNVDDTVAAQTLFETINFLATAN